MQKAGAIASVTAVLRRSSAATSPVAGGSFSNPGFEDEVTAPRSPSSGGGEFPKNEEEPEEPAQNSNKLLYGRPVTEVDPDLRDRDTFCVLSKKYGRTYVHRFSSSKSLFLLPPQNWLRRAAILVTTHQRFDFLIILTILANCVVLALGQNVWERDEGTGAWEKKVPEYEGLLNKIEYIFLAVYTLEMVLKTIAKGFLLNQFSYLRNSWNILDFVIVTSAYFSIIWDLVGPSGSSGPELEVLRTLRVLRAVKTISILPGLRVMMNTLLSSVVQLMEAVALIVSFWMIFALFGLEFYMGKFRQKCVMDWNLGEEADADVGVNWQKWVDNENNWLKRDFPKEEYSVCSNDSWAKLCPSGFVCLPNRGKNPDDGWTHFDHFGASMLSTFQLLTQDTWERVYELVLSTSGPWNILYFILVIFLGSYYLLNLMLAVVALSYENEANASHQLPLTESEKLKLVRSNSTFSLDDGMLTAEETGSPDQSTSAVVININGTTSVDQEVTSPSPENIAGDSPLSKCLAQFDKLSSILSPVVNHWLFEVAIMSCIICNTAILACERHNQPTEERIIFENMNIAFLVIFALEAFLKILALRTEYFKNGWNIFDLIIVIISVIDLTLSQFSLNLSVIRGMRLFRVFKLAQSWTTMKVLLNIIFSSFGALSNLTIVLLIVLYIFSVMGMLILGGNYVPEAFGDNYPKWNFSNFWYSFMMVFRVLCGQYLDMLSDCLLAHKVAKPGEQWKCFTIFLPIIVVGNFIVLNLFLALLLNSFSSDELKEKKEEEATPSKKSRIQRMLKWKKKSKSSSNDDQEDVPPPSESEAATASSDKISASGKARFRLVVKKVIVENRKSKLALEYEDTSSTTSSNPKPALTAPGDCFPSKCWTSNTFLIKVDSSTCAKHWSHLRQYCFDLVAHPAFEWIILILIFASSITLAFEDKYLDEKPGLMVFLQYSNLLFTIVFAIEMLLKLAAFGVWGYFTNAWNILDAFIVVTSLISIQYDLVLDSSQKGSAGAGVLKSVRTLRAFRPLRVISRWEGMKIVVNAIMFAIPSIFNVLLVCLLFWLVFSIMGVQFFKGKFYKCVDNSGNMLSSEMVPNRTVCCEEGNSTGNYSWINSTPNFDNVFEGYLALFQVGSFAGWIEVMGYATDATEVDVQPVTDAGFVYYIFFVIFIVFGSFFTLNLFVGVIIDNFNRLKKKYEGNLLQVFFTPSQKRYYMAMTKLGKRKPVKAIIRPDNKISSVFYDIAISRGFEILIFTIIMGNMVLMGFQHYGQGPVWDDVMEVFNYIFTIIYGIEAIIKLIGLRQYYFTVPWNVLDFTLVVASIVDVFASDLPIPPTMLRILRVLRIGRIIRLIKATKGIQKLLFALFVSLPALFNIGALLFLVTFVYAILGMALFKDIAKYKTIDEVNNFETFLNSCFVLLRLMTASGWNNVFDAVVNETPLCGEYRKILCGLQGEPECASRGLAVAYFISYIVITNLIVINMYVAIILENFHQANQDEEVGINDDDIDMFYDAWSRFDPLATQFIALESLSHFLDSLSPPLAVPKPNIAHIINFDLPIAAGNKVHCIDILRAVVKHFLGDVDDTEEFRKSRNEMERKFTKLFPTRKELEVISSTKVWMAEQDAALKVAQRWKIYRHLPFVDKLSTSIPRDEAESGTSGRRRSSLGQISDAFGRLRGRKVHKEEIPMEQREE